MAHAPVTTIAAAHPAFTPTISTPLGPSGHLPVLVMVGFGHRISLPAHSTVPTSHIPSTRLAVVSRASHPLPPERPYDVNAALAAPPSLGVAAC